MPDLDKHCDGNASDQSAARLLPDTVATDDICAQCQGTGKHHGHTCHQCEGAGAHMGDLDGGEA